MAITNRFHRLKKHNNIPDIYLALRASFVLFSILRNNFFRLTRANMREIGKIYTSFRARRTATGVQYFFLAATIQQELACGKHWHAYANANSR